MKERKQMKIVLTVILVINSLTIFGQSKWDLIGEYNHSLFMYSYTLILKDSQNYETSESSDLGSERTIGTWVTQGQTIRLIPKKKITVDVYKKEVEKILTDSKEEVVVIKNKDTLILKKAAGDVKLERTNYDGSLKNKD